MNYLRSVRTRMNILKVVTGAITAGGAALLHWTPVGVRNPAAVLLVFVLLNALVTLRLHYVCDSLRPSGWWRSQGSKLTQYLIVVTLGGALWAITAVPWFLAVILGFLCGIESMMMLDACVRLEQCGGVNMGLLRPTLQFLGSIIFPTPPGKEPPPDTKG